VLQGEDDRVDEGLGARDILAGHMQGNVTLKSMRAAMWNYTLYDYAPAGQIQAPPSIAEQRYSDPFSQKICGKNPRWSACVFISALSPCPVSQSYHNTTS
jgi:hypothetical protein